MQTACIPEYSWQRNFCFPILTLQLGESEDQSHDRGIPYTNIVTYCQVSYHVVLFYGKHNKIRRRDYGVCSALDGAAVWKISVKLNFPGTSEKLVLYTLLMHWHLRVLYHMQLCYTHRSTSWEAPNWRQADKLAFCCGGNLSTYGTSLHNSSLFFFC